MLAFGHLGVGFQLVRSLTEKLPAASIYIGTLLPDLIDKPLYYGATWLTGRYGAELHTITSTRTFGHSGLLYICLGSIAWRSGSASIRGLVAGALTHLLLDCMSFLTHPKLEEWSAVKALLWPVAGPFAIQPHASFNEHWNALRQPGLLLVELIGIAFLARQFWLFRRR